MALLRWHKGKITIVVITFIALVWLTSSLMPSKYRTGNVSSFHLNSKHLGDFRRIWVYLPPNYKTSDDSYPVLYMHDGQNVMDGNTSTHRGIEWRVDESLENMITNGEIPPLIVVAIDSNKKRHDEYLPVSVQLAGKFQGGRSDQYAAMLIEELMPKIKDQYRVKEGPRHTLIAGSSFGGILSFYLAINHSDVFGTAILMSPSLWWNDQWMKQTINNLHWKKDVHFWVDTGTHGDGDLGQFSAFHDALLDKGWLEPYQISGTIEYGATHIESAWARRFPEAISWALNQAVYVGESQ